MQDKKLMLELSRKANVSIVAKENSIKEIIVNDTTILCNSIERCEALRDKHNVTVVDLVNVTIIFNKPIAISPMRERRS